MLFRSKQAMVEVVYGRSLYAGAAHGPSPVSYTHLDVYKRQADAIALAVKLEGGCHHTAAMHSRNIENMNQMANAIDCLLYTSRCV